MQHVNKNAHFKRIIFTGSSGFLGHIILARLSKDDSCDVVVLLITGTNIYQVIENCWDYLIDGKGISDPIEFMSRKEKCFLILFSQTLFWSTFYEVFEQHKIKH
ncbi:hypothetical protein [Shewanella surugensis]|uniref:Thioester reductase (TE) domain-containing protein n=1 Tax=Shewanella surugensis TaxID=212020 RepID=A0ABT0LJ27_9GAMM|nr:hypothetical protein [Shewanella surugensis]MCL1127670.1 hypothetical protein [Shewanella surugensis]